MDIEPIDELANYLEKLEFRHQELAQQHEFLEKTVHTMTDIVEKDIEDLVKVTKHHKELITELQSDLFYIDTQQDQLVENFSVHREQTTRVLKMQERLQEASLVNVRTYEQKQLTAMVVHLMDKVDKVLKKHEDIQSVSDSEDTIGVLRRAIRWQHMHDKALDAKNDKKVFDGKKRHQRETQLCGKKTKKKCGQSQNQKLLESLKDSPISELPRRKWKKLALGKGEFTGDI